MPIDNNVAEVLDSYCIPTAIEAKERSTNMLTVQHDQQFDMTMRSISTAIKDAIENGRQSTTANFNPIRASVYDEIGKALMGAGYTFSAMTTIRSLDGISSMEIFW